MKRYPRYKDSGVEWLGEVPEHWETWKLAHAFEIIGSGTTPKTDQLKYYEGGDIPWVNTGDLLDGKLDDCEKRVTAFALQEHTSLRQYPVGSVLIAMYGATIGKLGILSFPATVNQACCVFAGKSPITPSFLFYWLLGMRQQLLSLATGGGQPNVSQDILRTLRVACPDQQEQASIAAFLDREMAKIDALVAEQRRLVELLREKRQAVISHAVTKGLNPNAKLKPSGIDWLGEVPEHWEVMAIKRFVEVPVTDGPHETPKFVDDGVPFVSAEAVSSGRIDFNRVRACISAEDNDRYSQKYSPKLHDVYMVKSGATTGVTAIVDGRTDFNIWSPLAAIRCGRRVNPFYLLNFMRSRNFQEAITLSWSFGTQQNIGMGVIENLPVTIPPVNEQEAIVQLLLDQESRFAALTAEAEKAISLLQERRTALISAAVTGKIDVRDSQAEPEHRSARFIEDDPETHITITPPPSA